jgi:hypothetical protein
MLLFQPHYHRLHLMKHHGYPFVMIGIIATIALCYVSVLVAVIPLCTTTVYNKSFNLFNYSTGAQLINSGTKGYCIRASAILTLSMHQVEIRSSRSAIASVSVPDRSQNEVGK